MAEHTYFPEYQIPEIDVNNPVTLTKEMIDRFHDKILSDCAGEASQIPPNSQTDQLQNPFSHRLKTPATGEASSTAKAALLRKTSSKRRKR